MALRLRAGTRSSNRSSSTGESNANPIIADAELPTRLGDGRSSLPFGHSAVERAKHKALQALRVDAQADERCPVEFVPPILPVDRALHPDGSGPQHPVHATLGEHRHISRREMRHHRVEVGR